MHTFPREFLFYYCYSVLDTRFKLFLGFGGRCQDLSVMLGVELVLQ